VKWREATNEVTNEVARAVRVKWREATNEVTNEVARAVRVKWREATNEVTNEVARAVRVTNWLDYPRPALKCVRSNILEQKRSKMRAL